MIKVLVIIPSIRYNFHAKVPYIIAQNIDKTVIDMSIGIWGTDNIQGLYNDNIPLYYFNGDQEIATKIIKQIKPDIVHFYRYEGFNQQIFNQPITACLNANMSNIIETNLMNEIDESYNGKYIKHHIVLSYTGLEKIKKQLKDKFKPEKFDVLYGCVSPNIRKSFPVEHKNGIFVFTSKPEYPLLQKYINHFSKYINNIYAVYTTVNPHMINFPQQTIVTQDAKWDEIPEILYSTPAIFTHCYPETFGLVIAEALVAGKSIVTMRFKNMDNAHCELIKHEETGFIAETEEEYIDYVNILFKDSMLKNKIGLNAYNKSWETFNPDMICKKLAYIYEKNCK